MRARAGSMLMNPMNEIASLFADVAPAVQYELPDADVRLYPQLFSADESRALLAQLLKEINWQQETIRLYGKSIPLPRKTAWYGDANMVYTYSGIRVEPAKWTSLLDKIRTRIEEKSATKFNCVLLNYYRNERDSVAWHADDEPELGENPIIGSVSFGETRDFQMKHKRTGQRENIPLEDGSYLMMSGATQRNWLHQIAKSKRSMNERINLTFRINVTPDG